MAASTARKTPRRSPAKDTSTTPDGVLRLSTAEGKTRFVEREPLFYIDDTEYTVPKQFPANIALEYMRIARQSTEDDAMTYLMTVALGEDGYRALCQYEGLTTDELGQVMAVVLKKVLGGVQAPKGSRRTA